MSSSLQTCTPLEQSQVSPPPATVGNKSLPLTFFDFIWIPFNPIHSLFFYELPITKTQFKETIVPHLKNTLSITLQHFFPFAGNLIVFPSPTIKPEIRYVEGDFVVFECTECNLDFNDLTGNHPRDCDKFYPLTPQLTRTAKVFDFITIPVFSVQVTLFPNYGFSIGMTNHHSLGDASTRFCFMKAWTSIARSGTDELFLANETFPIYERVIKNPKLDEFYVRKAKVETLNKDYQPPRLSEPSDKLRATVILTRTVITRLKNFVSTQLPTIPYISPFTIACAYIWSCIAESRKDVVELFVFSIDCRPRMDTSIPVSIPVAYFGNCVSPCKSRAKTTSLIGKEGFLNAAKMVGENLHEILMEKDGFVKDIWPVDDLLPRPTTIIGVSGTPKLRFYDMDFGWGKPKKYETISIDYSESISMNCCKESNEDLEIGVSLLTTEIEAFFRIFNYGLEMYI